MAQIVKIRGDVVCAYLLSAVLLLGSWGCGAISDGQDYGLPQDQESATIAEGCQHLISEAQENNNGGPLSSLMLYGDFTAQQGPFMAPESSGLISRRSVSFDAQETYARRTPDGILFRDAHLSLSFNSYSIWYPDNYRGPDKQRAVRLNLNANFKGVYSNRTGRFCATFCAGQPSKEPGTINSPALLAYKVQYPDSDIIPADLAERDCKIHIELLFPKVRTLATPYVTGVISSLRSPDDPLYFHALTISEASMAEYQYDPTVNDEARELGDNTAPDISSGVLEELKVWSQVPPFCSDNGMTPQFLVESIVWNETCGSSGDDRLCRQFHDVNATLAAYSYFHVGEFSCTHDWRVRASFELQLYHNRIETEKATLFAEGYWNFYKPGQLVMVAYEMTSDNTPVDTKILITLQIPMVRTIHHRVGVVGHVRSTRDALDPKHFVPFTILGSLFFPNHGLGHFRFTYQYDHSIQTRIQPVCSSSSLAADAYKKAHKNARFPDGSSAVDLRARFSIEVLSAQPGAQVEVGIQNEAVEQRFRHLFEPQIMIPRFKTPADDFADDFADDSLGVSISDPQAIRVSFQANVFPVNLTNGNYTVFSTSFEREFQMNMEGYYNSFTGQLCLLACWLKNAAAPYEQDMGEEGMAESETCDIFVSIQYPPTNPRLWSKTPVATVQISSLLDASHPRYFHPMVLNSTRVHLYLQQIEGTLLRRNAEIIMNLGGLSLATFLIALQVGYSSRESNFENLRFVSLLMLSILTSGHFFLLLLGFNAGLRAREMSYFFYAHGRWSDAHEAIIRGTSVVAFLLELRLMQLVWRSRTRKRVLSTSQSLSDDDFPPPKVSEVPVLQACLPVYATVVVLVAALHWQVGFHQETVHYLDKEQMLALAWADVQGFSGVILDLFLLPQVVANAIWNTQANVAPLFPLFYIGMTLVRSAEHIFDAARALNFIPELTADQYYYANPSWDLYSTTWDFIIPCLLVILAAVLFLQQRYGGRFFVPERMSRRRAYEPVGFLHGEL